MKKFLTTEDEFVQVVEDFFNNGGKGINVTVPFKNIACDFVEELSNYAKHAGAVNTIYKNSLGNYVGANTDGIGLLRDLKKTLRLQLLNKNILIIGAGGATQGIVEPLLNEQPNELFIANRTVNKAEKIVRQFKSFGKLTYGSLTEIPSKSYDLVLHATSVGLQGHTIELPKEIIGLDTCCYDLLYSEHDTPFMSWCKQNDASKVIDGFGMLLEQAAEAFYLWRGKRPDTGMAYHYFRPDAVQKPHL